MNVETKSDYRKQNKNQIDCKTKKGIVMRLDAFCTELCHVTLIKCPQSGFFNMFCTEQIVCENICQHWIYQRRSENCIKRRTLFCCFFNEITTLQQVRLKNK